MCIDVVKQVVAAEDRYAYKIVKTVYLASGERSEKRFLSPIDGRTVQSGYDDSGCVRTYTVGQPSESPIPATPGIYLYRSLRAARNSLRGGRRVVRVIVTAGTKCLMSSGSTMTAARIIVDKVMTF